MAGYFHEFEKSAHWSSLICICLPWLFQASLLSLLDWKGAGVQRRFCPGGITSPTAPFHLHLWDSRRALGRNGNLFPTAVAGGCVRAAINHFRGTNKRFPPCPSPSSGSLQVGVSVILPSTRCPFHRPEGCMILFYLLHSQVILCSQAHPEISKTRTFWQLS